MKKLTNTKPQSVLDIPEQNSESSPKTAKLIKDELSQIMEEANGPQKEMYNIRLIGHEKAVSKKTNKQYTNMLYQMKLVDVKDWEDKSTPIFTDEAKLILNNVDGDEDSVYLVTTEQDEKGYFNITRIELISSNDVEDMGGEA